MLANYGYQDGSGDFFIGINTDLCGSCESKDCEAACPAGVLEIIEDDYGDAVASVRLSHCGKIKYSCGPCKPAGGRASLPCQMACHAEAIDHSW